MKGWKELCLSLGSFKAWSLPLERGIVGVWMDYSGAGEEIWELAPKYFCMQTSCGYLRSGSDQKGFNAIASAGCIVFLDVS